MNSLTTGTIIDGRFKIERLLGEGGYGQVYEAVQLSVGRVVALKVLRTVANTKASNIERFQREAQYACRLTHPNTVIYYDFGRDLTADIMYLAMEFLAGETLQDRLDAVGTLSVTATAQIMEQICGSLDESHSIGLVHRDIKPANIMLINRAGRDDFVKVIDFGIAKLVQSILKTSGDSRLTGTGMMVGSPHYMAPEQIRGGRTPVDDRTDVYSLACLAYKMLTGRPPFDGPSAFDVATAQLVDTPPRLRELTAQSVFPAALQEVLDRALAKERADRTATVAEFSRALLAAVGPPAHSWGLGAAQDGDAPTPFVGVDALARLTEAATPREDDTNPDSATSPSQRGRRHSADLSDELLATNPLVRADRLSAASEPMRVEVTPDAQRPHAPTVAPRPRATPIVPIPDSSVGSPLRPLPGGIPAEADEAQPDKVYSKTIPLMDLGVSMGRDRDDTDAPGPSRVWSVAIVLATGVLILVVVVVAVVLGLLI